MKIEMELWHLITLLLAFFACVWTFGKALVQQMEKRLDERFAGHDGRLQAIDQHTRNTERELLKLKAELPNEYVRREDWIRFSGSIDTKLDRLRELHSELRELCGAMSEQLKALRRRGHGG